MSVNKTTGRGRGRPAKNRPTLDPVLRAALMEQDNEQAEKENSCVLSLITSQDKHLAKAEITLYLYLQPISKLLYNLMTLLRSNSVKWLICDKYLNCINVKNTILLIFQY